MCFQFPGRATVRVSQDYTKSLIRIDQVIFADTLLLGSTQESRIQTVCALLKSDNLEAYNGALDNADFVVAGEFGTDYMHSWLPNYEVADSTLELLR